MTLGESLDDSKVSLSDWIKQMDNEADALINFTNNAKKASDNNLKKGLIADLEAAGTAGALRMKQLANATDAEIARANKAWAKGQRAVDDYIDSVGQGARLEVDPASAGGDGRDRQADRLPERAR